MKEGAPSQESSSEPSKHRKVVRYQGLSECSSHRSKYVFPSIAGGRTNDSVNDSVKNGGRQTMAGRERERERERENFLLCCCVVVGVDKFDSFDSFIHSP
mmetsp:Transcript_9805/g.9496  ORF Transcript_9805/g.9496 Transcript_9805/m.9496 type:complete len:100 (-) Transcript_9805:25-324(-)